MATPNEDQLKDLVATYEKGVTLAVLANQFGVSIPTVTKWVRKGGGVIRSRGQRKKGTVTGRVSSVTTTESAPEVVPTATLTNPCEEVGPSSDSFVDSESNGRQIFQME